MSAYNRYSYPPSIRVRNTSTDKTVVVDFKKYCNVVLVSEFGCGTDGTSAQKVVMPEAAKALAICVRNYGWYRYLYPYNPQGGYDVTDNTNTQCYNWNLSSTYQTYSTQCDALNKIWNYMMFDSNKKLFLPGYGAGKYNGNKNSTKAIVMQNGANYLAREKKYRFDEILHYYYDNPPVSFTQISSGKIIVCESHTLSSKYTSTIYGHGHPCTYCGYYKEERHNWISFSTYYKCSVCDRKETRIPETV